MENQYMLSIDQSTQGTKALLFDQNGKLLLRKDKPHKQILGEQGFVSHDLEEIYQNTISVIRALVEEAKIDKELIEGLGISNQRETSAIWNRESGKPVTDAIVWQCSRARDVCAKVEAAGYGEKIKESTGIQLSPFFPASKFAWVLENCEESYDKQEDLMYGTIDTWLVYKLTGGKEYKTDYSNASRTQLLNLNTLSWDQEICEIFGLKAEQLAEICDSNSVFGYTDFEGYFQKPIPINAVMGDSHSALYGQGCHESGMAKATYGTGSSVMMNVGEKPVHSKNGIVSSLAWGMNGTVNYVLEGNINYTGAVISWMEKELELVSSAAETSTFAEQANKDDVTYFVPAFTGLGAPYWVNDSKAIITGISRSTGKKELAKAALECIAYQITDILKVMNEDSNMPLSGLRVDGGPTRNNYLMQFQSDIANIDILIPDAEELSGIGVAYMAGIALGLYDQNVFSQIKRKTFVAEMEENIRSEKYQGWMDAVNLVVKK